MDSYLSSLAKTLATGLRFELCPHEMKMNSQLNCVKCVEAVIREAIEKTLESAELRRLLNAAKELDKVQTLLGAATVLDDEIMDVIEAYRALRSLKQSNAGMEVRK